MRVAVFSDVHGNWTALQEVWAAIRREGGVDAVVCAGDLACFRPHPEECLRFLREEGVTCVLGNTDLFLLGEGGPSEAAMARFPFLAAQVAWCAGRLSDASRAWLRELPMTLRFSGENGDFLVCHATPRDLHSVCRLDAPDAEWAAVMGDFEGTAIAFGHVHVPAVREIAGKLYVNVAHCGLGAAEHVGYTVLTCTGRRWTAERRPVPHDPHAERAHAVRLGFPGAAEDGGY